MSHLKRRQLLGVSAFVSLVLSAGTALTQPQDVATDPPVAPESRNAIMNDSRNAPSAEAASDAMERGVDTPDLDVESPALKT